MSHRKFERPRSGSLGFLPRKRHHKFRGGLRSFPADSTDKAPHLTAFLAYKAGMTHIVRDMDRPGSRVHKKEVVQPCSVVECPPLIVVGVAGYVRSPRGLRCLATVWSQHLSDQFKRAYYKSWYNSKKKAFKKYHARMNGPGEYGKKAIERITKYCDVIRVVAHSQVKKLHIGQKKAHVLEIQVNGGATIADKVEFATKLFESAVPVDSVFKQSELVDAVAVTRGHGFEGVTHRWGTTRLPRKTHKGLRKVACIGAWHPARVGYSVPRAGQNGFHHRTDINKKIFRVGKNVVEDPKNGSCEADLTDKAITPMGGFPHFGIVKDDFLLIHGSLPGPVKRPLTLRMPLRTKFTKKESEQITLKFIDTASKWGHGRFQTFEEKKKFMGPLKKDLQ
eukprot:NODE_140_length_1407_cov_333.792342_g110_i0.p1 GENE.NODE_140_length_1407_cov_333.792342_g110_i0~~NODE_140_length_1407_cov_333.792342_g110_i0.p1  ORF type:complete len:392 (-),score=114.79 NODE_140_length_1407_cov_333.792342_g110_i0:175-1350(-)